MRGRPQGALAALLVRARLSWRRFASSLRIDPPASSFEQPRLWFIALWVGALSGYAALGFVVALRWLNQMVFDGEAEMLADAAAAAPPWIVLGAPIVAGLLVGLTLKFYGAGATAFGVADVVEARALAHGRIDPARGALSTLAALLSLGGGASAGREGPVVVAGASFAALVSRLFGLSAVECRTVLGCGVAAAVSASFNAPIAGALFALEVVLGHYAIRAFAPITIASVAGAIISRSHLGDSPAFSMPEAAFGSYAQFPAFVILGVISAVVAILMMGAVFLAKDAMDGARQRLGAPLWLQPAVAGAALGGLALSFPHILGVGYQTATEALAGQLDFQTCVVFAMVKAIAVAITLGGRFAGGVFSPALLLGALTGSAFGALALDVFPSVDGSQALYALAGMGAVAGSVLGAPISTTLIVFELTGDYGTAIAVMVSTSVATVATQQIVGKSFFHIQLARRAINLSAGPQTFLLPNLRVRDCMRPHGAENSASESASWDLVRQGAFLEIDDKLDRAFPMFRNGQLNFLPVVEVNAEEERRRTLVGALFYADALRAYNRALVEMHEEEHT